MFLEYFYRKFYEYCFIKKGLNSSACTLLSLTINLTITLFNVTLKIELTLIYFLF